MERSKYTTDLTDKQWEIIAPLLITPSSNAGRPPKYALQEILNAIFYLVHTGCQWREVPPILIQTPTVKPGWVFICENDLRSCNPADLRHPILIQFLCETV